MVVRRGWEGDGSREDKDEKCGRGCGSGKARQRRVKGGKRGEGERGAVTKSPL